MCHQGSKNLRKNITPFFWSGPEQGRSACLSCFVFSSNLSTRTLSLSFLPRACLFDFAVSLLSQSDPSLFFHKRMGIWAYDFWIIAWLSWNKPQPLPQLPQPLLSILSSSTSTAPLPLSRFRLSFLQSKSTVGVVTNRPRWNEILSHKKR